jgi:hypothetical protein
MFSNYPNYPWPLYDIDNLECDEEKTDPGIDPTNINAYMPGDEVVLDVDTGKEPRRSVKVIVLAVEQAENCPTRYLCYVPKFARAPGSFTITRYHASKYELNVKYVGDDGVFITASTPKTDVIQGVDGAMCNNCRTFIQYASLGADGTFMCHACKFNPYRV